MKLDFPPCIPQLPVCEDPGKAADMVHQPHIGKLSNMDDLAKKQYLLEHMKVLEARYPKNTQFISDLKRTMGI